MSKGAVKIAQQYRAGSQCGDTKKLMWSAGGAALPWEMGPGWPAEEFKSKDRVKQIRGLWFIEKIHLLVTKIGKCLHSTLKPSEIKLTHGPVPPGRNAGDGSFHTNPASEGHCNTEIEWGEKTFPACLHAQQVLLCQKDKASNPLICLLKF